MEKRTRNWLIVATTFVVIGLIIFGVAMTMAKWNFKNLSTRKYQTNVHEVSEEFKGISINVISADILFVPSTDDKAVITCYEKTNVKHDVSVIDGALTVSSVDTRKWYNYVGIDFNKPKITVSIPEGGYGSLVIKGDTGDTEIGKEFSFESIDIKISTGDVKLSASSRGLTKIEGSTGKIAIEDIALGGLDVKVSTGKIFAKDLTVLEDVNLNVSTGETKLTNVSCKNLISKGSTGDVELENVVASGIFDIKRSTGDVEIINSDANEIYINTSTGDVEGRLLSDKVFIVITDTGRIDVPKTITGGRCEITTDTGDVEIKIG